MPRTKDAITMWPFSALHLAPAVVAKAVDLKVVFCREKTLSCQLRSHGLQRTELDRDGSPAALADNMMVVAFLPP